MKPVLFVALALLAANVGHAQMPMAKPMRDSTAHRAITSSIGAQAMGVITRASPAHSGRDLTEGYLTQPMVMASVASPSGNLALEGMLDLEGLTLKRGELNAGMSGEGYIDRRHPHTYLHELVAAAMDSLAATRVSLAVGKGFVPYGTDDPMVRPFDKYPANHHLSQIVERLLATVAVNHAPFILEAARFNGDEPTSPSDLPNRSRLWDSWAARVTLIPEMRTELQASLARVKSPELPAGGGLDQRKTSVSFRFEDLGRYGLVEWARSSDYAGDTRAFSFTTLLAEGEVHVARIAAAARIERTERPEEERLADPFRTPRPSTDFSILGRTRWNIVTGRVSGLAYSSRDFGVKPFIEISNQRPTSLVSTSVFDPRAFYGASSLWSFTAGVSVTAGMIHTRVGQYGAAARGSSGMSMPGMPGM